MLFLERFCETYVYHYALGMEMSFWYLAHFVSNYVVNMIRRQEMHLYKKLLAFTIMNMRGKLCSEKIFDLEVLLQNCARISININTRN